MTTLLNIQDVSKSFGYVHALEDISLSLAVGESLAIVGGSGCGKTTLAKIICGLVVPDSGQILFDGKPLLDLSRQERAACVQMVFQDPYASLNPKLSIGTQLFEMNSNTDEVHALLDEVGFDASVLTAYPFQFSGGQRQRLALVRALLKNPKLLIADEPLSALDVTLQEQMLDLFRTLKKKRGLTILLITHDFAVVDSFAERALVMQKGRIVESQEVRALIQSPQHPYTQALLKAVPKISI